ncbi:MAG: sigma-70 family RNA polymerase sigma factor [Ruminococcus sp.]|nr:sigma-70 family RNA polymerase sigma factor [Ruminococcus sp.]
MDEVYREYAKGVYKYLLTLCHNGDTAEELTQETFYRAVKSLKSYDGSCKMFVWLCQIAKHVWYKELERRKKRGETVDENLAAGSLSLEDNSVLAEEKMRLFKALHMLDERTRETVYLRLTGEFSFREIGEILGMDETCARVTFYRGKLKIREVLDNEKE